jgi:ribonucleoside-diphosphate reductase alpha chain
VSARSFLLKQVHKRDGRVVSFDPARIVSAIHRATLAAGHGDAHFAANQAEAVVRVLEQRFATRIPGVEDVQDAVEEVLVRSGRPEVAREYMKYRMQRAQVREFKSFFGITDELKLDVNALAVMRRRYLLRDPQGGVIETPAQCFRRVAKAVAAADANYGATRDEVLATAEEFYAAMAKREFMPNSPTLMNAGTDLGQLSACFVLPVEDSLEGIFDGVKWQALIQQSGGGTGFSFSRLRPRGDLVKSTMGVASGPLSFIQIFDKATDVIKQGGRRRGANMGILRVDHPDILEFITVKQDPSMLANFNISVAVTDKFMRALEEDGEYELVNPRDGKAVRSLRAREVWDLLVYNAWKTGDPGLVFIDEINRRQPTPQLGPIESTNPCVTGDTRVYTAEGILPIRQLAEQATAELAVDGGRFQTARAFKTGVREVYELTTREGYALRLTADHRVMTERGWVAAGDLRTGDLIHLASAKGGFGAQGTREEGLLLGWLVGDGAMSAEGRALLDFYGEEKREVAPLLERALNDRLFEGGGGRYRVAVRMLARRDKAQLRSQRLYEFAGRFGLAEHKFQVPAAVFAGSEELQRGFLQALFTADGSVQGRREKGVSVRLAQSNLGLLRDVQQLLLNFGIPSKLYQNRRAEQTRPMPDGRGGKKDYPIQTQHELVVSRHSLLTFAEEIGFLTSAKQERLRTAFEGASRGPYRETFLARFEGLKRAGVEEVYDVNEPITQSFIANGLVVHNCGEVPLQPFDSCNLASINVSRFVDPRAKKVDWDRLRRSVQMGVHFLDNVIDVNRHPLPQIAEVSRKNRKIGLGVMGFAEYLIRLGIPYESPKALKAAEELARFLEEEGHKASQELAKRRGSFPAFKGSRWEKKGYKRMRNATVTTIAPTGTIAIVAGCNSGIEPLFAVSFVRDVLEGTRLLEVNPEFERVANERGLHSRELMHKIARTGSVRGIAEVPRDMQELFKTALEIPVEQHVRMQAAFQRWVDNAVSKTINLPEDAKVDDVRNAFALAHQARCKGITIYRYGSKPEQVLYIGEPAAMKGLTPEQQHVRAESEFAGGCPTGLCPTA